VTGGGTAEAAAAAAAAVAAAGSASGRGRMVRPTPLPLAAAMAGSRHPLAVCHPLLSTTSSSSWEMVLRWVAYTEGRSQG
jgi:hypothetical protein